MRHGTVRYVCAALNQARPALVDKGSGSETSCAVRYVCAVLQARGTVPCPLCN